jgi:hypothetical protein
VAERAVLHSRALVTRLLVARLMAFFFKRWYTGPSEHDAVTIIDPRTQPGDVIVLLDLLPDEIPANIRDAHRVPAGGVGYMIYGEKLVPDNAEDAQVVAVRETKGYCYARCYSSVEPEGEIGWMAYTDIEEISQNEFERARRAGWRGTTPPA